MLIGENLALHTIASRPVYISKYDIPPSVVFQEREFHKRDFLDNL